MHSQKTTVDNNSSAVNNMNDKKVVKFLIPAKAAGAIIGKGGSNIKNLREFFQAHITIGFGWFLFYFEAFDSIVVATI